MTKHNFIISWILAYNWRVSQKCSKTKCSLLLHIVTICTHCNNLYMWKRKKKEVVIEMDEIQSKLKIYMVEIIENKTIEVEKQILGKSIESIYFFLINQIWLWQHFLSTNIAQLPKNNIHIFFFIEKRHLHPSRYY